MTNGDLSFLCGDSSKCGTGGNGFSVRATPLYGDFANATMPQILFACGIDYANFMIKNVIFHPPATIVYWSDGTKTVVKCDKRDEFNKETGLALCYMKKMLGSSRRLNDVLHKWCGD